MHFIWLQTKTMSDPEIDAIRTTRRAISAEFNHDIHAALDYYRAIKRNAVAEEQITLCLTDDLRVLR